MPSPLVERAVIDAIDHDNALLKFISPNDTGLTGGHQCGYYLPRRVWRTFSPHAPEKGINHEHLVNVLWQDGQRTESCVKWYGVGTRSEYRMTRFGRDFPFLTPDNVGNLLVLIRTGKSSFHGYVLDKEDDSEEIQASLGVEIIGKWGLYKGTAQQYETTDDCIHNQFISFLEPLKDFPDTLTISNQTLSALRKCLTDFSSKTPDSRLMLLIENEYSLFKMVEKKLCQKEISNGFDSVDKFLHTASRIMNRRKSRAGRALENHVGYLLREACIPFDARPSVEGEPDILIPGKIKYEDPRWPDHRLFMVGVKTTCKDRWRQVLNEARRVRQKHILTVQPGISAKQLEEMRDSGVTLIVPQTLHSMYPDVDGMKVLNLNEFFGTVRQALDI